MTEKRSRPSWNCDQLIPSFKNILKIYIYTDHKQFFLSFCFSSLIRVKNLVDEPWIEDLET